MTLSHTFEVSVGDWSRDGHNESFTRVVNSSYPVQDVREMHFRSRTAIGFELGEMCREYEQNTLHEHEATYLHKALTRISAPAELISSLGTVVAIDSDEEDEYECGYFVEPNSDGVAPSQILSLWIWALKAVDPEWEFEIVEPQRYESLHFYGYDKKKRHLQTPGYGCFI